ncbi:PepSY domain-containing protein [Paludibacterium paludis]|uniref:PepSY domain-containing protein n=1 Tax=Paludibacterium paludis TaxID=1225769 RepID=A0A918UAX6_9NEIS|nr:PepSY domain-containing protein [Paludibacterium paludis]GGY19399.1 hypothetical protein GCM10011289_23690 [Paludibacterium paludis]
MRFVNWPQWLIVFTLVLPGLARADNEQDMARNALRAGEVLPLEQVLKKVRGEFSGEVLEVELERKGPYWVYEIKLLQDNGQLRKLRYNARTATLLNARSPDDERRRHGERSQRRHGS